MSDNESLPNFNENTNPLNTRLKLIVLVAFFVIIIGSVFAISLQYSRQDEPTYIIQGSTGTYNQTRSVNDSIINNGGFYIRFINGTNNPVILANSTSPLYGVNVTISDTTGGSETHLGTYNITLANGVTINNGGFQINMINGTNNPIRMSNTPNGVNITISDTTGSGGGLTQAYVRVQDEGTNQTQRFILNFIGSQVSCVDDSGNARTNCTITGDPLTGSGENCQIAFWTNSINLSGENDLCWDSTNNRLGILTSSRHSSLQVNGSFALSIKTITSSPYTLTENDYVIVCDYSSGSITLNLPSASTIKGRIYVIKGISTSQSNTCTVDPNSTQTIDTLSTIIIQKFYASSMIIQSDGTNWIILSQFLLNEITEAIFTETKTLTNIGTAYISIYTVKEERISTMGYTNGKLFTCWQKIGTGTQTVRVTDSGGTNVLVETASLSTGCTSTFFTIPSFFLNNEINIKLQAKSTIATDDPIFESAQLMFW